MVWKQRCVKNQYHHCMFLVIVVLLKQKLGVCLEVEDVLSFYVFLVKVIQEEF